MDGVAYSTAVFGSAIVSEFVHIDFGFFPRMPSSMLYLTV